MRRSVFHVHSALLAALGLPMVASAGLGCGGQTIAIGPSDASIDGAIDSSIDGAIDSSTDGAVDAGPDGTPEHLPFACVHPVPIVVDGQDTGYDSCDGGTIRRRAARACPSLLPRPPQPQCVIDSGVVGYSPCTSDTQCTAKPNGACAQSGAGGPAGCNCTYGCTTDSECPSGQMCVCGAAIGYCEPSSCTTSADCATPGADCADYTQSPGCPMRGFTCQTTGDKCFSDNDCPAANQCTVQNGVRVCQPQQCAVSRPFLVDGEARLPPLAMRSDWTVGDAPSVAVLSRETRERLASEWARVGQMEHASIAAFARFVLQLLSVGAPPRLVQDAQRAMADETNHAKLAFGLAGAYAGRSIGPGPLAVDTCLGASDLDELLVTIIREGCIGETVAAVEAREALEHARDPNVRAVLETIARDEAQHAELAWRTVAWALESGGVTARATIERTFAEASRDLRAIGTVARDLGDGDVLLAHGVIGDSHRAELRASAIANAVLPCAEALLARQTAIVSRPEFADWKLLQSA